MEEQKKWEDSDSGVVRREERLGQTWVVMADADYLNILETERAELVEALGKLETDNHVFGRRPCATCREIGEVLGRDFGCTTSRKRILARLGSGDGVPSTSDPTDFGYNDIYRGIAKGLKDDSGSGNEAKP